MEIDYKAIVMDVLNDMVALKNNYNAIENNESMNEEEKLKERSEFDNLFVRSVVYIMKKHGVCY